MSGVLEGLRVVSMEHMEAIPVATLWMADWGAEVIKIEPPTGDMFRWTTRTHGTSPSIEPGSSDITWSFQLLNRNKKSMAINLKTVPGREILYKLIEKADIFTSNYESGALKNLKADYDTLSKINPGLIYATISGYGTAGPDCDQRGFDHAAGWARSGMQYSIGEPGSIPSRLPAGMIDRGMAAPQLLSGIMAALFHREKTGEGQKLEVSLFHSGVWSMALIIQNDLVGTPMPKGNRTRAQNPLYNVYRTSDDRWLQLSMIQPDPSWPAFCRAIERPELENDPRFNTAEARGQNCEELIRIIDEVLATRTQKEWDERCREYDLIYSRVQSTSEVINDPQALANNFFVDLPHPAGQVKVVATPVKFHQNPASVRTPAPKIGQDNEFILNDMGYSEEDIVRLKRQGAIL